jgi:hypothetical protein
MQNEHPDLGEQTSVHRPSAARLWIMSIIALALLASGIVGVLLTLDFLISFFGGGRKISYDGVSTSLVWLGVSLLFLVPLVGVLRSDFRRWSATKTVTLTIYQNGFAYESEGTRETCHWDDIKDITHRVVEVRSKHSAPRRMHLIRSIVKKDGEMISLADTLDLMKVTRIISAKTKF